MWFQLFSFLNFLYKQYIEREGIEPKTNELDSVGLTY